MPKHQKPGEGTVNTSVFYTELKALVINGFKNEDRTTGNSFYASFLSYLKEARHYRGMTWAKQNKEWIKSQIPGWIPRERHIPDNPSPHGNYQWQASRIAQHIREQFNDN